MKEQENKEIKKYSGLLRVLTKIVPFEKRHDISYLWKILINDFGYDTDDVEVLTNILTLFKEYYNKDGDYTHLTDDDLISATTEFQDTHLALAEYLEIPPILLEHYDTHFDLNTYKDFTDGRVYAIGDEDEADTSIYEYFDDLVSYSSLDELGGVKDYISLNEYEIDTFAEEDAENRLIDLEDDDIIENAGYDKDSMVEVVLSIQGKINDLETLKEEKEKEIESFESELEDLELMSDDDEHEEDIFNVKEHIVDLEEEIEDIETQIDNLESDLEEKKDEIGKLLKTSREELFEEYKQDIIDEIENDGIDYFVNNFGYSLQTAVDNWGEFDREGWIGDQSGDRWLLAGYDHFEGEIDYEKITYYIYRQE